MLLALDTSTSTVTAAVLTRGVVLAQTARTDHRRHGELLAPVIRQVLAEAGVGAGELGAVVTGVGPGPFTGLRVGVVTARVLAHARGIPVHGVCSLDALAHQAVADRAVAEGEFLVATDARRKEVYWARYAVRSGGADRVEGPAVNRPDELAEAVRALPCVGRGPQLYPRAFGEAREPLDVSAAALALVADAALALVADAALAQMADAAPPPGGESAVLLPAEPLYLRRPDATVPGPPKQVHLPSGARP